MKRSNDMTDMEISVHDGNEVDNSLNGKNGTTKKCLFCGRKLTKGQINHHAKYCCSTHRRDAFDARKLKERERKLELWGRKLQGLMDELKEILG